MPKKNKYKSNRSPMIPAGAQFTSSYSAAVKDLDRFDQSQRSNRRKHIKNLDKGEY